MLNVTDDQSYNHDYHYGGQLFDTILNSFHSNYSSGNVQDLTRSECVNTFTSTFVSNYTSVILITNVTNTTNSFLAGGLSFTGNLGGFDADRRRYEWMCPEKGDNCTIQSILHETTLILNLQQSGEFARSYSASVNGSLDRLYSLPVAVDHCMAVKAAPHCQVSQIHTFRYRKTFARPLPIWWRSQSQMFDVCTRSYTCCFAPFCH